MTSSEAENAALRGEVLVHLRHGIRRSARLAEQLSSDAIVGNEARGLLGRLQAIRAELEDLANTGATSRHAHNDPFWSEAVPHLCQNG